MKVLFLKNVVNVWKIWDIKEVSDWYAINYLLPNKFVKKLTLEDEKNIVQEQKRKEQKRREILENKQEIFLKLEKKELNFKVKVWNNQKVFWSIWEKDILKKIKKDFNIELQKKHIDMWNDWHIKKLWKRDIYVKLWPDNIAKLTINVK